MCLQCPGMSVPARALGLQEGYSQEHCEAQSTTLDGSGLLGVSGEAVGGRRRNWETWGRRRIVNWDRAFQHWVLALWLLALFFSFVHTFWFKLLLRAPGFLCASEN